MTASHPSSDPRSRLELARLYPNRQVVDLPGDGPPILLVVIHTEEEFDWGKPFDSRATGVRHMEHIHRAQDLFRDHGVTPTYVVDYPIADQEAAWSRLKGYADAGECEIGAHCHPWVSPPIEETIDRRNSYPGNLPQALEAAKLERLTTRITENFGRRPRAYLAGRYGFGPHTGATLARLGYHTDISPAPPLDFSEDGGPNYARLGNAPFRFGADREMLCVPGTGAYLGGLKPFGPTLHRWASAPGLSWAHLPGILSRLKVLDRLRLSPEGYDFEDQRRLTQALLAGGQRLFVYSFHSPSVMPGGTPYVGSGAQLTRFLDHCRRYLDYFTTDLNGIAPSVSQFRATLSSENHHHDQ